MNRRIVYVQYGNAGGYPPLQHSIQILTAQGWEVLALGVHEPSTANLHLQPDARLTVKHLPKAPAVLRAFHFLFFALWVWSWTRRWRARWMYASDLYATPAALLASVLLPVKVIYHEHDTPTGNTFLARTSRVTRARLAHRAALCVLPNQERAETFARHFAVAAKTFCVWNCPTRAEVAALPARTDSQFRLLYHGSIVPSRLPLSVIDALAQLPERVCLRIVGYETIGHTGYVETLLQRARELELTARVEYIQQIPRFELLERARECDVGLGLVPLQSADGNEQTMIGASNKPFDYMACGLGMLVADLPDWRAAFVENGFARACNPNDAASIAGAVHWYLEHANEFAALRVRAQEKILREWNYENQFQPVLDILNR